MTLSRLEAAIVQTVAYVDMFDYPPTAAEIYRYLVGIEASQSEVDLALNDGNLIPDYLGRHDQYYSLPDREETVTTRQRRAKMAAQLWPIARRYGKFIAGMPFVKMVAVTGSLAVNNVGQEADIDYLIVTRTGRLWLCRAMIILIVRFAARRGISLCPNYILTERALGFTDQNLYAAHELVQMVPLSGLDVYWKMRQKNNWWSDYLPNAKGLPNSAGTVVVTVSWPQRRLQRVGEAILGTRLGQKVETWEMNRKIRRFNSQAAGNEAAFSSDWCKGHFESHGRRAIENFERQWLSVD